MIAGSQFIDIYNMNNSTKIDKCEITFKGIN